MRSSVSVPLTVDWNDQGDDTTEDPVLDLANVCDQCSVIHYAVEDFARGHSECVIDGGVVGLVVRLKWTESRCDSFGYLRKSM